MVKNPSWQVAFYEACPRSWNLDDQEEINLVPRVRGRETLACGQTGTWTPNSSTKTIRSRCLHSFVHSTLSWNFLHTSTFIVFIRVWPLFVGMCLWIRRPGWGAGAKMSTSFFEWRKKSIRKNCQNFWRRANNNEMHDNTQSSGLWKNHGIQIVEVAIWRGSSLHLYFWQW